MLHSARSVNRSFRIPRLIPLALLCGVLLAGMGCKETQDAASDEEEEAVVYTGQELFRGLVLGDGPVAEEVETVREYWMAGKMVDSDEKLRSLRDAHDRMLAQIAERDSAYFDEFREAILSGDRPRIAEALQEGAVVSTQALSQLEEMQEFRQALREDPEMIDQMVERVRAAEDVSPEEAGQLKEFMTAFAQGELQPDRMEVFPVGTVAAVTAVTAAAVAHTAAAAVNYAGAINVAVAVNVTFWVNAIPQGRPAPFGGQEPGLLREQMVEEVATKFGR